MAAKNEHATRKNERAAEVGEYDEALQTLLQIVWGDGFLSPGGPEEVARVLQGVELRGKCVLDIGCGLGAIDVLLVREHGAAHVTGIDLEPGLLAKARRRIASAGLSDRIDLVQVSAGPLAFASARFDVVFSKDSMVQIPDKPAMFSEIHRILAPGGRFVASDWLRGGEGEYSAEMIEYFRLEGITYNMASGGATRAALAAAGFVDIEVRDQSGWYRELAARELESIGGPWYPMLVEKLGGERARHFVENWRQLVLVLERGELRPTHLAGRKPLS